MAVKGRKYLIYLFIILFATISFLAIYSASFYNASRRYNNAYHFMIKQVVFYFIGMIILLIFSKINYKKYAEKKGYLFLAGIFILILVLLFGVEVNGAKRWLRIGSISIQPSEFAKLIFIIYLAGMLDKFKREKKEDFQIIIPAASLAAIYIILIFLEKDLSTALHLFLVVFFMLTLSNIKKVFLFGLSFLGSVTVLVGIRISGNRMRRIDEYLKGMKEYGIGGGYQVRQSVIAIGSGGVDGSGFGNGLQKYYYLPELHTDFIFSILAEEFGYIATLLLVAMYIITMLIGIKTVFKTKDYFGKCLAFGITFLIISQAVLNLYVVSGLIPATGIPLPFISSGGSSIIMLLASLGIIINIIKEGAK